MSKHAHSKCPTTCPIALHQVPKFALPDLTTVPQGSNHILRRWLDPPKPTPTTFWGCGWSPRGYTPLIASTKQKAVPGAKHDGHLSQFASVRFGLRTSSGGLSGLLRAVPRACAIGALPTKALRASVVRQPLEESQTVGGRGAEE